MSADPVDLPLGGVRVLDLSRVLAGPLACMVLGDLGADVLKVENSHRGDDTRGWGIPVSPTEPSYYLSFNRNKRSVAADLTKPEGQELVRELAAGADVIVENFKAGGMEKFGIGYDSLKALNSKLIYCAVSGYDRAGPEAARPGYDVVIQGESGLMSINGEAGQPPLKFGVAAVDLFTGMYAAQAILAALYERQRTGKGRRIDLALYDCGVMISSYYGLEALLTEKDPPRYGNQHPSIVPYGVFDAEDGPLVIAVGTDRQFGLLCSILHRPELADDPLFSSNMMRSKNRAALFEILEPLLRRHKRLYILDRLAADGVPCGQVLGIHEALRGSRTELSGLIGHYTHASAGTVPIYGSPWRFDGHRLPIHRPPPGLGEHSYEPLWHDDPQG